MRLTAYRRGDWEVQPPDALGVGPFGHCWAREELTLPRGRATLFLGFQWPLGSPSSPDACPTDRPRDHFLAHVYFGETVVVVAPALAAPDARGDGGGRARAPTAGALTGVGAAAPVSGTIPPPGRCSLTPRCYVKDRARAGVRARWPWRAPCKGHQRGEHPRWGPPGTPRRAAHPARCATGGADPHKREEAFAVDSLRRRLPSLVRRYLAGIRFPISKGELIGRLERNGVPGLLTGQLRKRLPEREYRGPQDVFDALRRGGRR